MVNILGALAKTKRYGKATKCSILNSTNRQDSKFVQLKASNSCVRAILVSTCFDLSLAVTLGPTGSLQFGSAKLLPSNVLAELVVHDQASLKYVARR